jgi:hypothetical protein
VPLKIKEFKRKPKWKDGMWVALDPKTSKVLAEAKTVGDTTSLGISGLMKDYKGHYVLHYFEPIREGQEAK